MSFPQPDSSAVGELVRCWRESPHPSIKISSYFPVYADLFSHLRGTDCTFVETGILDGGSLFMWRAWLGPRARIVGIDLNPAARKWEREGFVIHTGDQGDPAFWSGVLPQIGRIDAFLDDGGHQSFQQIVTLQSLLAHIGNDAVVAVEDTSTSFMSDFASHGEHSFLAFAKDATDCVIGRSFPMYPGRMPTAYNTAAVERFAKVASVNFYNGIVAFRLSPGAGAAPKVIRNRSSQGAADFRHAGSKEATVDWPDVRAARRVTIKGAG